MVVETAVDIAAPVDRVWETLVDIAGWPRWDSVLRRVTADGGAALVPGLHFRCTVAVLVVPILFEATVVEVVHHQRIVWTSDWLGIHARHEFLCTRVGTRVRLTSREHFRGAPTLLMGPLFPTARVRRLTTTLLHDLKRAVEGESTGTTA